MRNDQNKRWAVRRNNGHNPHRRRNSGHSSRSNFYESNGPDVKIRGTAANIAEKYRELARDAHTSGDLITAEAYHQYAEHYYRLVAEQERSRDQ